MRSNALTIRKLEVLEAVRGFAALYVFLHHAKLMPNHGFGRILYFGQEAVIVFFLLSGFVINLSVQRTKVSIWPYLVARFRRIYPVFICALLLAYLAACIQAGLWVDPAWGELLGNILMLQDASDLKPGVWVDTYQRNSPLWSLSYEWWFYLAFVPLGVADWMGVTSRRVVVAAISIFGCLSYWYLPNQASLIAAYLILWWIGVELSSELLATRRVSLRGQAPMISALAVVLALWMLVAMKWSPVNEEPSIGVFPYLQVRHFGFALTLSLIAVWFWPVVTAKLPRLLSPFAVIAPVSYFLYAAHKPALDISKALLPFAPQTVRVVLALVFTLSLGWVIERSMRPRGKVRVTGSLPVRA